MLLLTGSGILQADNFRQYLWNKDTYGLTDTCFAASSSNLLTRTAWRAFMATLMDVVRVVCHGWRYCLWTDSSCSVRAVATLPMAPAYMVSALPSLSLFPPGTLCNALAAVVEARQRAWGNVLCCATGGAVGEGTGRLVPLRLVAAKVVMPWPMLVESSEIDS